METKKVFIQANNKQLFGAKIARFALRKYITDKSIDIEIINVDNLSLFQEFNNTPYLFNTETERVYNRQDLQSFTLSRFMPPELMNFEGKAVMIDPDIFALVDINELFTMNMQGNAIVACAKKDTYDTSVMLLDCKQLTHWKIKDIISSLREKKNTYMDIMTLKNERNVKELSRIWNNLDTLTPETKMLHTTGRLTQPWKTGLPIDFTRNKMQKMFGIIPREWIHKLLGKYPTHYQPHPDKKIDEFFFDLARETFEVGVITKKDIDSEIKKGYIRKDFLELLY